MMSFATFLAICVNGYLFASLSSIAFIGMFNIVLMILFFVDLYRKKSIHLKDLRFPGDILLGLFVLVTFISMLFNYSPQFPIRESFIDLRWIFSAFIISWAFENYLTDKNKLNPVMVFSIIISVYTVLQFFSGFDLKSVNPYVQGAVWRARGLFSNPIRLANIFGAFGILILPLALDQLKKKNYLYFAAFLGCFISMIFYLTRGTWIGFFIAVPFILFFYKRKWIIAFFASIIVLTAVLFYISPDSRSRVTNMLEAKTLETEGRLVIWRVHSKAFINNFWIGTGAGTSGQEASKFSTEEELKTYPIITHAHNEVLDILVTRGIFGGLIFILINLFYISLGLRLFKSLEISLFQKSLALGSAGAVLFLFISGLTEANIESNDICNMLVMSLAILIWIEKSRIKNPKSVS